MVNHRSIQSETFRARGSIQSSKYPDASILMGKHPEEGKKWSGNIFRPHRDNDNNNFFLSKRQFFIKEKGIFS